MVYEQPRICPEELNTQRLWDSEIQTDHQIWTRQENLIIINKKERTFRIMNFAVPADHRIKLKESEKKDKYLDLAWELKKTVEHEIDDLTNCKWCSWYSHQRIGTRTEGFGNNYLNYSIIEIGQNSEKSPEDLRRLAVTQTQVNDRQPMLMSKTLKE